MKYDVIGDIHGCYDELQKLINKLGYNQEDHGFIHPKNRILVFLGDLTDRGPSSLEVIHFVYQVVVVQKTAKYVPGNHCNKLYRFFQGNNVQLKHGIETTVAEYERLSRTKQLEIRNKFMSLYEQAPLYLELNDVQAMVAHAGIKESLINKHDKKVKSFVLYGDVSGEVDKAGRPVRRDWAKHYNGSKWIVYGHTPVLEPRIINNTINIDTGCVFGNRLTAFRLPEKEIISISSKQRFIPEKFKTFNI